MAYDGQMIQGFGPVFSISLKLSTFFKFFYSVLIILPSIFQSYVLCSIWLDISRLSPDPPPPAHFKTHSYSWIIEKGRKLSWISALQRRYIINYDNFVQVVSHHCTISFQHLFTVLEADYSRGEFTVMWKARMAVSGTGKCLGWLYPVLLLVLAAQTFTV